MTATRQSSRGRPVVALRLGVQYASDDAAPARAQVRRWVAATLRAVVVEREAVEAATLAFRFVGRDEGRALNRAYRGKNGATNVLTFPFDDAPRGAVAADIVVCMPIVEREAREQAKTVQDHCAHLVVHGTLHACGYDHETPRDAAAMEAIERAVLRRFRIADPYRDDER